LRDLFKASIAKQCYTQRMGRRFDPGTQPRNDERDAIPTGLPMTVALEHQ